MVLVIVAAAIALVVLLGGCSATASRAERTWSDVRDHPVITEADRDAMDEACDFDASRRSSGLVDLLQTWGLALLGIGGPTGVGTVLAVNRIRDSRRRRRGEPVEPSTPKA